MGISGGGITMLWMAGLSALALLICLPLFLHYKRALRLPLAVCFKGLGTLCAFVLALIAAVKLDPRCYVCSLALLIHVAADIVLEFSFLVGGWLFLAGHLCYIAFFLSLVPVSAMHLICVLLLLGFSALFFWRWRKNIGKQLPVFALYAAVLSVMCACALGCFASNTLSGILIACGGALFFFSDSMLLRRLLFPSSRAMDWIIMFTYYAAQLLFGIACLQL